MENNKKNKKKLSQIKSVLTIFILPLIIILIFLIIVGVLILPKISEIFEQIEEVNEQSSEIEDTREEIVSLQNLAARSAKLISDLEIINSLAPTGQTEVVNFQNKITELARGNNLTLTSQRLSDIKVDNTTFSNSSLVVREVPNLFNVVGSFEGIMNFIEGLSLLDDFIVVQEMSLSQNNDEARNWILTLTVVKFQFQSGSEQLNASYLQVPPTARIDEEVQEYIDSRSINNTASE